MSAMTPAGAVEIAARALEPGDWCWDEKFPAEDRAVAAKRRLAAMRRALLALSRAGLALVPKSMGPDAPFPNDVRRVYNIAAAAGNLLAELASERADDAEERAREETQG